MLPGPAVRGRVCKVCAGRVAGALPSRLEPQGRGEDPDSRCVVDGWQISWFEMVSWTQSLGHRNHELQASLMLKMTKEPSCIFCTLFVRRRKCFLSFKRSTCVELQNVVPHAISNSNPRTNPHMDPQPPPHPTRSASIPNASRFRSPICVFAPYLVLLEAALGDSIEADPRWHQLLEAT